MSFLYFLLFISDRSSRREISVKILFLKISQNLHENTCSKVSFLIKLQTEDCDFIKEEGPAWVFSCEIFEIFKNTFL